MSALVARIQSLSVPTIEIVGVRNLLVRPLSDDSICVLIQVDEVVRQLNVIKLQTLGLVKRREDLTKQTGYRIKKQSAQKKAHQVR
jgi:hypothetical protein